MKRRNRMEGVVVERKRKAEVIELGSGSSTTGWVAIIGSGSSTTGSTASTSGENTPWAPSPPCACVVGIASADKSTRTAAPSPSGVNVTVTFGLLGFASGLPKSIVRSFLFGKFQNAGV